MIELLPLDRSILRHGQRVARTGGLGSVVLRASPFNGSLLGAGFRSTRSPNLRFSNALLDVLLAEVSFGHEPIVSRTEQVQVLRSIVTRARPRGSVVKLQE